MRKKWIMLMNLKISESDMVFDSEKIETNGKNGYSNELSKE